jgi:hypothetical protein
MKNNRNSNSRSSIKFRVKFRVKVRVRDYIAKQTHEDKVNKNKNNPIGTTS